MNLPARHPFTTFCLAIGMGLVALISGCGGGGGGGGPGTAASPPAIGADTAAFPLGLALGSPTGLVPRAQVTPGATGISAALPTADWQGEQLARSSQIDAVATGRLAWSSALLNANDLFNTSAPTDALCFGPAVLYTAHEDDSSSGQVNAGQVGFWQAQDSATNSPCAAAQVNARLQTPGAQVQQALLIFAALRQAIGAGHSTLVPGAGSQVNVVSEASALLASWSPSVNVSHATVALSGDGLTYTYRLVLLRGSGAQAQSLELALQHNPGVDDTHFGGTLQVTLSHLSTNAAWGCADEIDSATSRYKVARLLTLLYQREDDTLSLRLRGGQYCGAPNLNSASHLEDLATVNFTGELAPEDFLTSSTRSQATGWRSGFVRMSASVSLGGQGADFLYAWQDEPTVSASGHARLLVGHASLDENTGTRSIMVHHGDTYDIGQNTDLTSGGSDTIGTLLGLACNRGVPGVVQPLQPQPYFQSQTLTVAISASDWSTAASHIAYAPTSSCSSGPNMRFDANGDGTLDTNEGASFAADLLGPTGSSVTVQDEVMQLGFISLGSLL